MGKPTIAEIEAHIEKHGNHFSIDANGIFIPTDLPVHLLEDVLEIDSLRRLLHLAHGQIPFRRKGKLNPLYTEINDYFLG